MVVKCRYGQLIITENNLELRLNRPYTNRSRTVLRSAITGVQSLTGVAGFPWIKEEPTLRFSSIGNITILAEWLTKEDAMMVKQELGF